MAPDDNPDSDDSADALARPDGLPSLPDRLARLLERLGETYMAEGGAELAARAREEFLVATGRVNEDDRAFDDRMALFMEWFLLARPLERGGDTPAEIWAAAHGPGLDGPERELLVALCVAHHSLFELVAEVSDGGFVIDDLIYSLRWQVEHPAGFPGLGPGDVFEARLVGFGGQVHFTTAFCYHPREAAPRIRRWVERRRDDQSAHVLLAELMQARLVYDRAEGAPVDSVYRLG